MNLCQYCSDFVYKWFTYIFYIDTYRYDAIEKLGKYYGEDDIMLFSSRNAQVSKGGADGTWHLEERSSRSPTDFCFVDKDDII